MFSFKPSSPEILNNLISVKIAAIYSGYSSQYIRRMLRSGILSGEKVGQVWLVDKKMFDSFLDDRIGSADQRFGPKVIGQPTD